MAESREKMRQDIMVQRYEFATEGVFICAPQTTRGSSHLGISSQELGKDDEETKNALCASYLAGDLGSAGVRLCHSSSNNENVSLGWRAQSASFCAPLPEGGRVGTHVVERYVPKAHARRGQGL